jgi:hypothetical protein
MNAPFSFRQLMESAARRAPIGQPAIFSSTSQEAKTKESARADDAPYQNDEAKNENC